MGIFTGRFIWNDGMYSDEREAERRRNAVDDVFAGKVVQPLEDCGVVAAVNGEA